MLFWCLGNHSKWTFKLLVTHVVCSFNEAAKHLGRSYPLLISYYVFWPTGHMLARKRIDSKAPEKLQKYKMKKTLFKVKQTKEDQVEEIVKKKGKSLCSKTIQQKPVCFTVCIFSQKWHPTLCIYQYNHRNYYLSGHHISDEQTSVN